MTTLTQRLPAHRRLRTACGLQSSKKYNGFERQSTDYADVPAAFQAAQFGDYRPESARHNMSGHIFPGMTVRLLQQRQQRRSVRQAWSPFQAQMIRKPEARRIDGASGFFLRF